MSAVDWYAARAAGVVAYTLLTTSVLLGTLLSGRARSRTWPAFAVADVHRFVALLTGWFVALHVVTVLLDSVVPFSLAQVLVPDAASYRPFWVGLGTVAAELLLAIALTNLYRKELGFRLWRRAHYLTFGVWLAGAAHGIGAGTDASAPWLRLLYVVSVGGVAAAVAWRVARRSLDVSPGRA